jgi:uncharacterized protein YceK
MTSRAAIFLGLVALATCAGCSTVTTSDSNGSGLASPQAPFPRCMDGVYNRAAGICVSPGGS